MNLELNRLEADGASGLRLTEALWRLHMTDFRLISDEELSLVSAGAAPAPGTIIVTKDGTCFSTDNGVICHLADPNNYSQDGQLYYSEDGMAFRDYPSCVNYYANQIHDQNMDALALVPPYGTAASVYHQLFGSPPTQLDYRQAADLCG